METKEVFIGGYQVRGNYDYVGVLNSNYIYDNRTTFFPGDGILYSLITNHIDFSFSFGFNSKPVPVNTTIDNIVSFLIESDKNWNKTLNENDIQYLFSLNNEKNRFSFRIVPDDVINYVDNIDEDIGVITENFTIYVIPYINTRTHIGGISVDNVFEPTLKIEFKEILERESNIDRGKSIIINDNLKQTKAYPVTQSVNMTDQNVARYRQYSMMLFIIILVISVIEGYINRVYLQAHITSLINRKNETFAKNFSNTNDPHKDRILEANSQSNDNTQKYILSSLNDLAKSGRYSDKKFEIFYIKEGNTIYEYVYSYTIIKDNSVTFPTYHEETTVNLNETS
jgi:hypothetical protein